MPKPAHSIMPPLAHYELAADTFYQKGNWMDKKMLR